MTDPMDTDAFVEAVAERLVDLVDQRRAARLVDTAEAADVLGVPESWLATRARNGEAPCRRLGKYVRFDLGELRAWIDSTTASGHGAGLGPVPPVADRQRLSALTVAPVSRVPSVVPRQAA